MIRRYISLLPQFGCLCLNGREKQIQQKTLDCSACGETFDLMLTIRAKGKRPTVETLRSRYGLRAAEFDESFGVVDRA